jgi:predicted aconitase with swiveling domain
MSTTVKGRVVIGQDRGVISGKALVTTEPICFLGGVDVRTGNITEQGHPLYGECIKDTILVFPTGKGSTGGSYLIYDTIMNGNGPKCMLNLEVEQVTAIGCIMGEMPLIDKTEQDITRLIKTGDEVSVDFSAGAITF